MEGFKADMVSVHGGFTRLIMGGGYGWGDRGEAHKNSPWNKYDSSYQPPKNTGVIYRYWYLYTNIIGWTHTGLKNSFSGGCMQSGGTRGVSENRGTGGVTPSHYFFPPHLSNQILLRPVWTFPTKKPFRAPFCVWSIPISHAPLWHLYTYRPI